MTKTLTLNEAIASMQDLQRLHGNVPVVLWDMDSNWYYQMEASSFEPQIMEDGSARISIGIESGYGGDRMPDPAKRPA